MIRQAISCDICGAEKKHTNHWFVASEQGGELRVTGWNSRNRLRAGSKHLCGQVCLHKLADEFMARVIAEKSAVRAGQGGEEAAPRSSVDSSLTSPAAFADLESSARLLTPPEPPRARVDLRPELVPRPELRSDLRSEKERPSDPIISPEETSRYSAQARRAEAWERERARAARSSEQHSGIVSRRLSVN